MEVRSFGYGYGGDLAANFDDAVTRVKDALASKGFGVQAEIRISEALKTKLGVEIPREVILGVCNPSLAHRAIQMEPEITVLLPCNVTVRETQSGVHIAAIDARAMVEFTRNANLEPLAGEAEKLLLDALSAL